MSDKEFKEFCKKERCVEAELFLLTEEQMNEIANTELVVGDWRLSQRRKRYKDLQKNKA